jgi:hypothetical protein
MNVETKQQEIRDAAQALLDAAGVRHPPVDLVGVARLQGIEEIKQRKMRRTLGTLREGPHGLTVTLNRREPYRARFTLAHEIAHTIVDPPASAPNTVALARRKPRSSDELERLCDEIAVELLLPYELFLQELQEPLSLNGMFRLAKQFDASLQATALRAGELAREPVQVVCWERSGRRTMRVKAQRGREYLTGAGASERSLDDDTPIARAFAARDAAHGIEFASPGADVGYECEARGFLSGTARFVISIVRPAMTTQTQRPKSRKDRASSLSVT